MSLWWSKPPDTIICPVCGARVRVRWDKNSQFQPKPFCDSCGWNVTQARRHFLAYVRQSAIYAPLFAVFAWAVTGIKWGALFMAGWMLIIVAIPIITNLRRLPPSRPAPLLPPLAGIADVRTLTLDVMTPRLNVILEGLIVVAAGIAIAFLPREFDPARRNLPGVRHDLLFVALTTIFVAYQLGLHSTMFFRLVRSLWLERHLAKRAMTAKGRIVESNSGAIKYEFLDYTSNLLHGSGRDYSMSLYEGMPLSILYDPDEPSLNMPVVGLQFHRQRGAP